MRTKTTAQLKKQLDKVFSLWVRLRDTKNEYGNCYTCNKNIHYKEGHAGHFVSRQYLSTRWNHDNVKLQCVGCNIFGGGKLLDFEENLIKELGKKKVEELKRSRHLTLKLDRQWYEEKLLTYSQLLKELQGL